MKSNELRAPAARGPARLALGVGALAALSTWLVAGAALGQGDAAAERARLRDEARVILAKRCDGCHESTSKAANQAALGAFDLDRPGWAERMAARQIRQLPERIRRPAFGTPEDERRRVDAFVAVELGARGQRTRAPRD
ncbi:MAG TPA: hypothetical protein VFS43_14195 [Polyangiaceae bacterium]|nr:hypothetical protein [Polyangiaceae bacterium]